MKAHIEVGPRPLSSQARRTVTARGPSVVMVTIVSHSMSRPAIRAGVTAHQSHFLARFNAPLRHAAKEGATTSAALQESAVKAKAEFYE
jgi:hypothetical protein